MFVYMLMCDGFEESEAVVTADILARGGVEVRFVSPYGKFKAVGSHGFVIEMNDRFPNSEEYDSRFSDADAVVLPGGKVGTDNLRASGAVRKMVREYSDSGKVVAAICAAPTVLGAAGLLSGKKMTCYPGFEGTIKCDEYTATPCEIDGNIVTGRSMGCAVEFGLGLLSKLKGDEAVAKVREGIVMP
ncbi:MAG: DJ-1/PfpI family protein [Lachnospiraceae bacterium]|nr:DJ-1/PfpI family protein [Lachnospiraceae bacterium]